MSREVLVSNSQVVESLEDLNKIFVGGARPLNEYKIGMEFERFLVDQTTHRALPFEGKNGIENFLNELSTTSPKWEKITDQGKLISLKYGETAITLEPGGQVEISSQTYHTAKDLSQGLTGVNHMMMETAAKQGAVFVAKGVHPNETIETAPWMPKSRYRWMREYYEKRQQSAFEMMLLSASIQVNFDYSSEADAKKKVMVSSFLSPMIGAIYANSSIEQGKPNGYITRRIPIWEKTDPDRCGTPRFYVDGTFSFEKYRDYALDIPMYFALRNGEYVDVQNQTFREFIKNKGGKWGPVTMGDWEFHLTTLFPEVRLKNHLEFRTADSNPIEMVVALATLWKGLFYNSETVDKWFIFFKNCGYETLKKSMTDVSKHGLQASFETHKILTLGREILADSVEYYQAQNQLEEILYLKPIQEILDRGSSPGEAAVLNFQNTNR